MKIKELAVNISKKISRVGTFGSDMISASMTMEIGTDFEEEKAYKFAFGECWKEIEEQEKILKEKTDLEDTTKDIAEEVSCPIHKVPMQHYIKDGNEWWSHKLESGEYCNGKNNLKNKSL